MSDWNKLKEEGNTLLKEGDSKGAVAKYSQAIDLCPKEDASNQQILFSNRSAAYLKAGDVDSALRDAEECIRLGPTWAKAYSRKAAVLKEMKRYQEACEVAEEGLKHESTNVALKTIQKSCETSKVCDKLRGVWHGKVAEEVGGYMQTFDFWSDNDVRVQVLGTTVDAKYELNVFGTPYPHLDMSVPNSPGSAFVRHIYRFENDDELHLCSPYLRPPEERPTEFQGAGMVIMKRGAHELSAEEKAEREKMMALPFEDRVSTFLEECIEAVPNFDVRPMEGESDIRVGEKLTANVKFQTYYQSLIEKLGADAEQRVKELVIGVRSLNDENDKTVRLVNQFQAKMRSAGLMSDGEEEPQAQQPTSSTNHVVGTAPEEVLQNKEAMSRFVSGADEPLIDLPPLEIKETEPVKPKAKKASATPAASSSSSSSAAPESSSADLTPVIVAVVVVAAVATIAAVWFGRSNKRD